MVGRLLFFVIIGVLAYWFLKRLVNNGSATTKPPAYPAENEATETIRCSVCGIYVPRSEALMSKGQYYCDSHRPDHLK